MIKKHNQMKKLILLIFPILILQSCSSMKLYSKQFTGNGDGNKSVVQKTLINRFFSKFKRDSDDALDFLFETNSNLGQEKLNSLKSDFRLASPKIGKLVGYELIGTENLKNRVIVQSYLVRFANYPLRFTFKMYKPKSKWVLMDFDYDVDFIEEMEKNVNIDSQKKPITTPTKKEK